MAPARAEVPLQALMQGTFHVSTLGPHTLYHLTGNFYSSKIRVDQGREVGLGSLALCCFHSWFCCPWVQTCSAGRPLPLTCADEHLNEWPSQSRNGVHTVITMVQEQREPSLRTIHQEVSTQGGRDSVK
jgi:hypothetical protein